jgi:hypothetical protein
MSLDVGTFCPCCHSNISDQNITYNVSGIYYRALRAVGIRGGLRGLHGRRLGDIIDQLKQAKAFLHKYEDRLRKYEPDNGWGDISSVHRVFDSLILAHDGQDPSTVAEWDYCLPGRPWLLIDAEGPYPEAMDPVVLEQRVGRLENALRHTFPNCDLEKVLASIEGAVA